MIRLYLKVAVLAVAIIIGSFSAQAQKAGGTLVYIVQPEPPTLAGYVSTSGPIGLVAPKIYEGLFDYDNGLTFVKVLLGMTGNRSLQQM